MNQELKNNLMKIPPVRWLVLFRRNWILPIKWQRQYRYYTALRPEQYRETLKKWYEKSIGKTLDLENPQTYNEKVQWLKIFDSTPLKSRLTDKYLGREVVAEKIGAEHLVRLLGVYDKFDDINFDVLPEKFVIRANHDGLSKRIVTDKSKFDVAEARHFFNHIMCVNIAFCHWLDPCYKNIAPKIIIEEYLENNDNSLYDYKFWCFGGKVEFIMLARFPGKKPKVTYYDTQWKRMNFKCGRHQPEEGIEKPDNLEQMIKLAEALASGFAHVRVDLFRLNDGTIKFGEMLFSPDDEPYKWDPPEYDKIFGNLIKLPTDKK